MKAEEVLDTELFKMLLNYCKIRRYSVINEKLCNLVTGIDLIYLLKYNIWKVRKNIFS
jgi:hypothetical protein